MSKKYVLPNDIKIQEIQPRDTNKASFYETIDYLICHDDECKRVFLKKRISESGEKIYSHVTITNIHENGKKQTEKNQITKDVYDLFMKQKNNNYKTLYRKITSFIEKAENYVISEYYEDKFYNKKTLTQLLAESLKENGKSLNIPSYLKNHIVQNVTNTERLSSWNLAQNDKKDLEIK